MEFFSVFSCISKGLHSFNKMKLIFLVASFICVFQSNNADFKEGFSEIICSMKRTVYTEMFIGTQLVSDQVILSKRVFKDCDFQVRIFSTFEAHRKTDLIAIGFHQKDIKVYSY